MTNGEAIRSKLTDEEIAKNYFCTFFYSCDDCPLHYLEEEDCNEVEVRLNWLGSEGNADGADFKG